MEVAEIKGREQAWLPVVKKTFKRLPNVDAVLIDDIIGPGLWETFRHPERFSEVLTAEDVEEFRESIHAAFAIFLRSMQGSGMQPRDFPSIFQLSSFRHGLRSWSKSGK